MFLSPQEIIDLTGRQRRGAQLRALRGMGITHMIRPDGTVVVLRAHIESALGNGNDAQIKTSQEAQPNWGAIVS